MTPLSERPPPRRSSSAPLFFSSAFLVLLQPLKCLLVRLTEAVPGRRELVWRPLPYWGPPQIAAETATDRMPALEHAQDRRRTLHAGGVHDYNPPHPLQEDACAPRRPSPSGSTGSRPATRMRPRSCGSATSAAWSVWPARSFARHPAAPPTRKTLP